LITVKRKEKREEGFQKERKTSGKRIRKTTRTEKRTQGNCKKAQNEKEKTKREEGGNGVRR